METIYKSKTLTTLCAGLLGSLGIHRFYLHGVKDTGGWLHLLSVPLSLLFATWHPEQPRLFLIMPFMISGLIGFIEALALGLTPDDQWDARYNPHSRQSSASGWPLAILLILIVSIGATSMIALLARTVDLLYSSGAYG